MLTDSVTTTSLPRPSAFLRRIVLLLMAALSWGGCSAPNRANLVSELSSTLTLTRAPLDLEPMVVGLWPLANERDERDADATAVLIDLAESSGRFSELVIHEDPVMRVHPRTEQVAMAAKKLGVETMLSGRLLQFDVENAKNKRWVGGVVERLSGRKDKEAPVHAKRYSRKARVLARVSLELVDSVSGQVLVESLGETDFYDEWEKLGLGYDGDLELDEDFRNKVIRIALVRALDDLMKSESFLSLDRDKL